MSKPVHIRWTDSEGDRQARSDIVRAAWHVAYGKQFSAEEIDAIFDGDAELKGSWSPRRTAPAGTIVAVVDDEVVGVISLAIMDSLDLGEVVAFYVKPGWQGQGVGTQLWNAGLSTLAVLNCSSFEVWTMADGGARSFYEDHGCRVVDEGWVQVGERRVPAIGCGRQLEDVEPVLVPFE